MHGAQDPLRATEEEQLHVLRSLARLERAQCQAEVLRRLIDGDVLNRLADVIVEESLSFVPQGGSDDVVVSACTLPALDS